MVLRVGIVGYGYMGRIRRASVDRHADLRLVGICDPALDAGSVHDVPTFRSHDDLFMDAPEIVFVCTPNRETPDVVIAALQRGCHVFCEKPPGRDLRDIERIIATEQRHPDQKLIFGFNHRHHPSIRDAKAIVDSEALGPIMWLRGVYGKSGGEDFERSWRNDPEVSGGGILLDQGIHMLDLFRFFCGDFDEVRGMVATSHWPIPVEDNAFVLLRDASGRVAQLHSSATLWKHTFELHIGLAQGYLVISGLLSKSGSYGRETLVIGRRPRRGETSAVGNPREEVTYYDTDPSWDLQVDELVRAIREDRPLRDSTSADALAVMRIIENVYRQERLPHGVVTPVA